MNTAVRGAGIWRGCCSYRFAKAFSVGAVHPVGSGTDYARSLAIDYALVVLAARAATLS